MDHSRSAGELLIGLIGVVIGAAYWYGKLDQDKRRGYLKIFGWIVGVALTLAVGMLLLKLGLVLGLIPDLPALQAP